MNFVLLYSVWFRFAIPFVFIDVSTQVFSIPANAFRFKTIKFAPSKWLLVSHFALIRLTEVISLGFRNHCRPAWFLWSIHSSSDLAVRCFGSYWPKFPIVTIWTFRSILSYSIRVTTKFSILQSSKTVRNVKLIFSDSHWVSLFESLHFRLQRHRPLRRQCTRKLSPVCQYVISLTESSAMERFKCTYAGFDSRTLCF